MTDRDDVTPNDEHLDDEALSAVLDGEAAVDESSHADACDDCRTRLAVLRDVTVLLAAPVPPPDPARRDAAVAAAMAAVAEPDRTVVPLRRRMPPAWLAAAAAVLVVVGAIALVPRAGDDDASDGDTASGADAATEQTMMGEADTFSALAAPVDGGDLGEIDTDTLQETIEASVSARRSAGTADDDAAGGGASSDAPAAATSATSAPPCEVEVRDDFPELGALVYRATGTVGDEPVAVLGFDVPPDRWVFVVSLDGCAIRNQQTYSQ